MSPKMAMCLRGVAVFTLTASVGLFSALSAHAQSSHEWNCAEHSQAFGRSILNFQRGVANGRFPPSEDAFGRFTSGRYPGEVIRTLFAPAMKRILAEDSVTVAQDKGKAVCGEVWRR